MDAPYDSQNEREFEAAARKGFESLDRGEFISHEEVVARLERRFQANASSSPKA
jgi:predicted transcriptional regulator